MTLRRQDALWKQALGDSLLGNRGLAKASMMLLPWAVMLGRGNRFVRPGTVSTFFLVLLSVFGWLMTCILANDLADSRDDRAAGKQRWINRLPSCLRVAVAGLLFCLGPAILVISKAPGRVFLAYVVATVLGLAYSLEPFRFKTQGALGILFYSLSCVAAYVLIPWAWLDPGWKDLPVVGIAVFLDKWVNLHFHQVIDLGADRAQGVETYAVLAGAGGARRNLRSVSYLTMLPFAFVLYDAAAAEPRGWRIATLSIVFAAAVVVGLVIERVMKRSKPDSAFIRELPSAYLASAFAVFRVLPLVLILRFCLETPALWPVGGTALILVAVESRMLFRYPF